MRKIKDYSHRFLELCSFFYYKICIKTGWVFCVVPKIFTLKTIPFKQWPPELALKSTGHQYVVSTKNTLKFMNIDEKIFTDKSISYGNEWHSFHWVAYASIASDKKLRRILKTQIKSWIDINRRINKNAWSPIVVARRMFGWLTCYHNIIKTSEKDFHKACLSSLSKQFKFLKNVRFLNYKISQIIPIYKSLMYFSFMNNKLDLFDKFLRELIVYLEDNTEKFYNLSPIKIVSLLRDLEEIYNICSLKKNSQFEILQQVVSFIKSYVRFIINKNGLAVFDSKYTPTINFMNSVCQMNNLDNYQNPKYERICAFCSDILIDKLNEFFQFEFTFENQPSNITNRMSFHIFNPENILNSSKICGYELEQDHGYSLVRGNSVFDYLLGKVSFSRRIYMNSLGTEIRGECIIASSFKMSIINEFIVYEDVDLEQLVYQNGVSILFKNGRKILLNLGKNIDLSFSRLDEKVINGVSVIPTIIRLEAFKNANVDCVCKWVLKEI